jgi:hypothetical protein
MSSTDEGLASKLDVSVLYSDALKEALASDPDPLVFIVVGIFLRFV